jgi:pilus assembly protein Flp/PilA
MKEDSIMLKRIWKDESGQGMVEYGLIIGLVAIAVIAALILLGGKITNLFNGLSFENPAA